MTISGAVPGCPVYEDFDPLSPGFLADPFAVLATLPAQTSVFYAPAIGYHVVMRYAEVERVLRDAQTYSAAVAQQPLTPLVAEATETLRAGGHPPQPSMVSLDGPAHARLRRAAVREFTARRVHDMAAGIRSTIRDLLDGIGDAAEFDVIAALAFPLAADTIFSLIGVPRQDYAQLKRWCGHRAALSWGRPAPADQVELARTIADEHLAFGKGVHHCPGASLGRLQAQLVVDELTSRFPRLRLVDGQRLTFHPNISFRGPQTLWVRAG